MGVPGFDIFKSNIISAVSGDLKYWRWISINGKNTTKRGIVRNISSIKYVGSGTTVNSHREFLAAA